MLREMEKKVHKRQKKYERNDVKTYTFIQIIRNNYESFRSARNFFLYLTWYQEKERQQKQQIKW